MDKMYFDKRNSYGESTHQFQDYHPQPPRQIFFLRHFNTLKPKIKLTAERPCMTTV